MDNIPVKMSDRVGIFIGLFILTLIVSSFTGLYLHTGYKTVLLLCILLHIGLIVLLYRYAYRERADIEAMDIVYLVSAFVLMVAVTIAVSYIAGSGKTDVRTDGLHPALFVLFFILFSPLTEELLMRGVFFRFFGYERWTNIRWFYLTERMHISPVMMQRISVCILSAGIFTILHGDMPLSALIIYMTNGIIAGALLYRTSHVIYPVLFHMMINGMVAINIYLI